MPQFVYTGPAPRVTIKGRTFDRGVPTDVDEAAAEAVAGHSGIVAATEVEAAPSAQPTALDELVTWLEGHAEGETPRRDILLDKLRALDADAIASIAEEYELGVETDVDEASLNTVADAILGVEPEPAPEPQRLGERQKVYDRALKDGILEAPMIARSDDGIAAARIEDGKLVQTLVDQGGDR